MKQTNWAYYIAMQAGVVPITESAPGPGKTAVCRAVAASSHRFIQLILIQKLKEDIGGVPVPTVIEIDDVLFATCESVGGSKATLNDIYQETT